ncbi:MAG TPA: YceI family protein [Cryomorphaceae bacterium]|nr:YceI family protein [Cryomorphaceae bacterium]HCY25291.1 YceI family protein [Cryomorphaceae bacterium]|tara:strand:+ start:5944 stop:6621 length:678 start_codon:yes stop_codon:yes gene_type:complete
MKKIAIIAAVGFLTVSCGGEKANQATTGEAQEVNALADAEKVVLDAESVVEWKGFKTYTGDSHNGTMGLGKSYFAITDDELVGGAILIDLNKMDVTDLRDRKRESLLGHLRDADFFFVDSFPTALFEITEVNYTLNTDSAAEDGLNTIVSGNLTLRGVTNSIEFPARISVENGSVSFDAPTFSIDRTLWGVNFHNRDDSSIAESLKDNLIDHSIELTISVKATKA